MAIKISARLGGVLPLRLREGAGLFNALFFGGVGRVSPKCHTPMLTAL
jgi:hypothetical protein